MQNFQYFAPTKIIFGKETEKQVGALVKKEGAKKVLLHYGMGSVIRSGLLDLVKKALEEEEISYVELGGVVPNPRLSLVYEGIELCKKEKVDFILSVGGGSVLDSAKAIGYGVYGGGDVWDFYIGKRKIEGCLPIGTIITIAATGSEMSNSSVITNEEAGIKKGSKSDTGKPRFAIMNPELTMTLPDYQTACGCTDILMHTMERYFTKSGSMDLTDGIAEALMRTVLENARILAKDPKNYEARAEVMWAGSLSHNGLTSCGGNGGDWACHGLEHEIGAMFDVAHGAGLAAIWGSWARYVYQEAPDRFLKFATRVMGITEGKTEEETILKGIEAMEEFYREIQMPTSLSDLGIAPSDEQLHQMADQCIRLSGGKRGTVLELHEAEAYEILRMANDR